MCRTVVFTISCFVLFSSIASARHEEEGMVNVAFPPLKIGSPEFPESVYSGISLSVRTDEAPADLRFSTGQAAWLGTADATIVDTDIEQSVFTLDTSVPVSLTPFPGAIRHGLAIGDFLPQHYYGFWEEDDLNSYLEVKYRLVGASELREGRIIYFFPVPEPDASVLTWVAALVVFVSRRRRPSCREHSLR